MGTTTSHCRADGVNQPARRKPGDQQSWVAPEWGWAWPANRRILYNRASADPDGRPWSERKAYLWWNAEQEKWAGHDVPDFSPTKAPDHVPPEDATGVDALTGTDAFIMQADGKAWLYAPAGLTDGPLPTHYEPQDSPIANPLYTQQRNPVRQIDSVVHPDDRFAPSGNEPGTDVYPYVLTTYRIAEHHTAGGMSRWSPYLAELAPDPFCEVSPELAAQRGLVHGNWATIVSPRGAIEARGSYYGKPVLNPPVWEARDIAGYLFLGGLAGSSSLLGAAGRGAGASSTQRPSRSTLSWPGSGRAASLRSRSCSWSITCTAVVGSFTPGESARSAMSTSWRSPNPGSSSGVRSSSRCTPRRSRAASGSPPRTRNSGPSWGTNSPTARRTSTTQPLHCANRAKSAVSIRATIPGAAEPDDRHGTGRRAGSGSVTWSKRSRRNVRSTRGENCPLVSCSTTIVIENTSAVNEIIELTMADSSVRAPSGPPANRKAGGVAPSRFESILDRPSARSPARIPNIVGSTQKRSFSQAMTTAFLSRPPLAEQPHDDAWISQKDGPTGAAKSPVARK